MPGGAIAVAPDHAGFDLKENLERDLQDADFAAADLGMTSATSANRNSHVRAALAHDVTSARFSREHNEAKLVAFGQRLIGRETVHDALKIFLDTGFAKLA